MSRARREQADTVLLPVLAPQPPATRHSWPVPARLSGVDVARLGAAGLRRRRLRAVLAALGLAIGTAAVLAAVGVTVSGRADVDRTLHQLGTNLLTAAPDRAVAGGGTLPVDAVGMVGRIAGVASVAATGRVEARAYRTDRVPAGDTGGVDVLAVDRDLPETLHTTLAAGSWLTAATASYPAAVLGSAAAARLDLHGTGVAMWLGGQWYAVVGILAPVPLAPELDDAALIGWTAATRYAGFDGHPTTVYLRTVPGRVAAVRSVLARTADPQAVNQVRVDRPSDALPDKAIADVKLAALLLGLGAVALFVGGIGVANRMVIATLERRPEIGLCRALGATAGQVRVQFLAESLVLAGIGGVAGVPLGIAVTVAYALMRDTDLVVPGWASLGVVGVAFVVGALAGIHPAIRAGRVPPAGGLAATI